jgi:hypothetical protein
MELSDLVPVVVVWHDAHVSVEGWEDLSNLEDDGPCVVHSSGFLLPTELGGKTNHVSMVATWSDDDMVHSVFHIPMQMVQRIEVLVRSYELADVNVFPTQSSTSR